MSLMAEYRSIFIILFLLLIKSSSPDDQCWESSCGHNQPLIRFPFQLVKGAQDRCVDPDFCLYCNENKETMFFLPTTWGPMEFLVVEIYYELQWILVMDPKYCIPMKFMKIHNSSFLPYRFHSESQTTIEFFNCSSVRKQHLRNQYQSIQELQNMITCPIYATRSSDSVLTLDLASCTKMLDVNTHTEVENLRNNRLSFSWQKPNCSVCAANGKKCRWNNRTKGGTECFDCVNKRKTNHIPKSLIFAATGQTNSHFKISSFLLI